MDRVRLAHAIRRVYNTAIVSIRRREGVNALLPPLDNGVASKGEGIMRHVIVLSMLALSMLVVACSDKPVKSNGPPVEHLNYITWDTAFGTEHHEFETCVVADPYGGGVVAGGTGINPNSIFDAYLVFFDKTGSYYERTYYSYPAQWVEGICALDDGFAVAGCNGFQDGSPTVVAWIARFDWSGNIIWETYYAGIQAAEAYCITVNMNGDLVVGAFTFGDFADPDSMGQHSISDEVVVLFDGTTGEVLKETSISNDSFFVWYIDGIDAYDGGVAVVGWGYIHGQSYQAYLTLLDDTLGIVKQTSPASCLEHDWTFLLEVKWDGDGFIAAGSYDIDGLGEGESQMMLVRFTRDGDIDWCRTFGEGKSAHGRSVAVTRTGYAAVGYVDELEPIKLPADVYLVLTDKYGNVVSEHTYEVADTTSDTGGGIDVTADGGLLISARSFPAPLSWGDIYVIKTDPYGNVRE